MLLEDIKTKTKIYLYKYKMPQIFPTHELEVMDRRDLKQDLICTGTGSVLHGLISQIMIMNNE